MPTSAILSLPMAATVCNFAQFALLYHLQPISATANPKNKNSFLVQKRVFVVLLLEDGGDKRDRTADLLNAIQALSRIIWCTTPDVRESAYFKTRPHHTAATHATHHYDVIEYIPAERVCQVATPPLPDPRCLYCRSR